MIYSSRWLRRRLYKQVEVGCRTDGKVCQELILWMKKISIDSICNNFVSLRYAKFGLFEPDSADGMEYYDVTKKVNKSA